jgi:hypothetical protein
MNMPLIVDVIEIGSGNSGIESDVLLQVKF